MKRRKSNSGKLISLSLMTVFIFSALSFAAGATAPENWEKLEKKVRDNQIPAAQARSFAAAMRPVLDSYYSAGACVTPSVKFIFPVEGYKSNSVGGRRGSGYYARRYDFYDHKKHSDHPAQDIFIMDSNHDTLDDRTKQTVRVLSVSAGLVVSSSSGWEKGGKLRGGNYIWIYDPVVKGLYYYAHLSVVTVKTGQFIEAGEPIGTVGRTGANADARRSPTHLHLMFLRYGMDGAMKPENIYTSLTKGTTPEAGDNNSSLQTIAGNSVKTGAKKSENNVE